METAQLLSQINLNGRLSTKLGFFSMTSSLDAPIIPTRKNPVPKPISVKAFIPNFQPIVRNRRRMITSAVNQPGEAEFEESNSEAGDTSSSDTAVATLEAPEESSEPPPERKPRIKLGDIMGILNRRAVDAAETLKPIPDIRTGDVIELKLEVPENKRRLSVYKGIVMSRQNAGIHTTIRVRRVIAGVGVEIVFPLYSPNIKEIKVVKHRKVRRARLYYLRDMLPRFSSFK